MFELSDKTKELIEESVGLSFDEIINKDVDEMDNYIEDKIGKKLEFPEDAKIDGYPIRTMDEVDKRIDEIINPKRMILKKW